MLFYSWAHREEIVPAQVRNVENVEFSCAPLQYPPELFLAVNGSKLRILIDFGIYYTPEDISAFKEESAAGGYSSLMYSFPLADSDSFYSPENLKAAVVESFKGRKWIFSRLCEQWRQRFLQVAQQPAEYGMGYECVLHYDYYRGKYSSRWIDCAHCRFNVTTPPACLCTAASGIGSLKDFHLSPEERKATVEEIRSRNDKRIQEERERAAAARRQIVEARVEPLPQRVPSPSPPAHTPEELEVEYQRIVKDFNADSPDRTVDKYGRRWIHCDTCGRVKLDSEMTIYGGRNGPNRGECRDCARKKH